MFLNNGICKCTYISRSYKSLRAEKRVTVVRKMFVSTAVMRHNHFGKSAHAHYRLAKKMTEKLQEALAKKKSPGQASADDTMLYIRSLSRCIARSV